MQESDEDPEKIIKKLLEFLTIIINSFLAIFIDFFVISILYSKSTGSYFKFFLKYYSLFPREILG